MRKYDKRWENTFVTAYTNYSGVQAITNLGTSVPAPANVTYAAATVTLTAAMCTKYGIDASHVGEKIYPYVDVNARNAFPECEPGNTFPRYGRKGIIQVPFQIWLMYQMPTCILTRWLTMKTGFSCI
jgi:hypothetical protein